MSTYEVELGALTESRNAETQELFAVEVEVHVRRTHDDRGVRGPQSGDYVVRFDIDGGVARFRDVEAEAAYGDLALVAIRAAARELDAVQDSYDVESPLAAMRDCDYTVHDQLPRSSG